MFIITAHVPWSLCYHLIVVEADLWNRNRVSPGHPTRSEWLCSAMSSSTNTAVTGSLPLLVQACRSGRIISALVALPNALVLWIRLAHSNSGAPAARRKLAISVTCEFLVTRCTFGCVDAIDSKLVSGTCFPMIGLAPHLVLANVLSKSRNTAAARIVSTKATTSSPSPWTRRQELRNHAVESVAREGRHSGKKGQKQWQERAVAREGRNSDKREQTQWQKGAERVARESRNSGKSEQKQ